MSALLNVTKLSKSFGSRKDPNRLQAVREVSFTIAPGEILGVVGESGCGKSTLARCIIRLETPTSGSVVFDGSELTVLSQRQLRPIRPRIQMVFQNPFSSFNPKLTVGKSLWEVARLQGLSREEYDAKITNLLATTALEREWLDRRPVELSGGQLQRFAVVRALLSDPELLIADEAVSALDVSVQAQMLNLFSDLRRDLGLAILFISHDLSVVRHLCDRVLVMYLGSVMEMGESGMVLDAPAHPYTRALLAARPRKHPEDAPAQLLLRGSVEADRAGQGCLFASRCPRCGERCLRERPELSALDPSHSAACFFTESKKMNL